MPGPEKVLWSIIKENDVHKDIVDIPEVHEIYETVKDFGQNTGENIKKIFSHHANTRVPKPVSEVPTVAESALPVNRVNSLTQVVSKKDKLPETTISQKTRVSVHLRDFTFRTNFKKKGDPNSLNIFAGEEVGVGLQKKMSRFKQELSAKYNIFNKEAKLRYSYSSSTSSGNISAFMQEDNVGGSVNYRFDNKSAKLSVDKHSTSVSFEQRKKYDDCVVELGVFATTGRDYSSFAGGITGRITL